MSPPKVSIAVLTHNHEAYIVECLDSIRRQTYPALEVVVSDDRSQDGTLARIRAYQARHPEFAFTILENTETSSISAHCNRVLEKLSGEYVCCFSGDDIMLPEKIARQVEALERHPSASFAYSNCEWFLSDTGKKICNHFGLFQRRPHNIRETISDFTIPTPTLLVRASMMPPEKYDERLPYFSDSMLVVRLMQAGEAVYVPEVLVRYRKHKKSVTAQYAFVEERVRLLQVLETMFAHDADIMPGVENYRAIYHYSVALDRLRANHIREGLAAMGRTAGYWLRSFKWLVRAGVLILELLRALKRCALA